MEGCSPLSSYFVALATDVLGVVIIIFYQVGSNYNLQVWVNDYDTVQLTSKFTKKRE